MNTITHRVVYTFFFFWFFKRTCVIETIMYARLFNSRSSEITVVVVGSCSSSQTKAVYTNTLLSSRIYVEIIIIIVICRYGASTSDKFIVILSCAYTWQWHAKVTRIVIKKNTSIFSEKNYY